MFGSISIVPACHRVWESTGASATIMVGAMASNMTRLVEFLVTLNCPLMPQCPLLADTLLS